jgi:hypothetical protein
MLTEGPLRIRFGRSRTALKWSAFPRCTDVASRFNQTRTPGRCRRSMPASPSTAAIASSGDSERRILAGDVQCAIAGMRIGAIHDPAVYLRIRRWRRPREEWRSPTPSTSGSPSVSVRPSASDSSRITRPISFRLLARAEGQEVEPRIFPCEPWPQPCSRSLPRLVRMVFANPAAVVANYRPSH